MNYCGKIFFLIFLIATVVGCGVAVKKDNSQIISKSPSGQIICATDKCHSEFKPQSLAFKFGGPKKVHKPTRDLACETCHFPSNSFEPKKHSASSFIPAEEKTTCISCHKKFGEELGEKRVIHPLIGQGKCSPCHNPHGSASPALLRKTTSNIWGDANCWKNAPLLDQALPLCLDCHDESVFTIKAGADTKFRNGRKNLHFQHIESYRDRCGIGRTLCSNCHEIHSSDKENLIKSNSLSNMAKGRPFNYTPSESGGSCDIACHKPTKYDRKMPEEKK